MPRSQLIFNDTDVSYSRNSAYTSSFRSYYYTLSTLVTGGRTYLIHPTSNPSLCLTFSNITSGMPQSAFSAVAGLPLRFTPCTYIKAGGQGAGEPFLNSQLFKVLRRCDPLVTGSFSALTPYVLQMWSAYNENGTVGSSPIVPASSGVWITQVWKCEAYPGRCRGPGTPRSVQSGTQSPAS